MTDRALDYWQQALAAAGDDPAWQVDLFHNLANVYARRCERAKAIEWMSKSIALAGKIDDKSALAAGLQELGDLHLQDGQTRSSPRANCGSALKISRGHRREAAAGRNAQPAWAICCAAGGMKNRSARPWRSWSAPPLFARGTGEPAYIWRTNTMAGQLYLALHEPDRARAAFEESIAAIEDTYADTSGWMM